MPIRCLIESSLLSRLFSSVWFQRLIGLKLAIIALWNMVPAGFNLTGFGIYVLLFVSALVIFFSRIEVSMLARYSLVNFEAVYLIIWATVLFGCSAWQYQFEYDTFGAGTTPLEYAASLVVSSAGLMEATCISSMRIDLYFLLTPTSFSCLETTIIVASADISCNVQRSSCRKSHCLCSCCFATPFRGCRDRSKSLYESCLLLSYPSIC